MSHLVGQILNSIHEARTRVYKIHCEVFANTQWEGIPVSVQTQGDSLLSARAWFLEPCYADHCWYANHCVYSHAALSKVKCFPVHAMKACRGSRGVPPQFLNLGTRCRRVVTFMVLYTAVLRECEVG